MNSKKIIVVFSVLLVVLFFALSALRYSTLNKMYPDVEIVEHSIGEEIKGGEIYITVESSELWDGEQTRQIIPDYTIEAYNNDGTIPEDDQIRNLIVHLKVENKSDSQKSVSFVNFTPESNAWKNGLSLELYTQLNPGVGSPLEFKIEANSKSDIILPYTMIYSQFKEKDWEHIEQRDFKLVLSQYPIKHVINLG